MNVGQVHFSETNLLRCPDSYIPGHSPVQTSRETQIEGLRRRKVFPFSKPSPRHLKGALPIHKIHPLKNGLAAIIGTKPMGMVGVACIISPGLSPPK